jgi:alcohol dehydrogenase class IV
VTGSESAQAADGAAWVRELCDDLAIPRLGQYGLTAHDLPELTRQAQASSSMKGNPFPLSDEEVIEIVREAL